MDKYPQYIIDMINDANEATADILCRADGLAQEANALIDTANTLGEKLVADEATRAAEALGRFGVDVHGDPLSFCDTASGEKEPEARPPFRTIAWVEKPQSEISDK
jgi:hypothetical protein